MPSSLQNPAQMGFGGAFSDPIYVLIVSTNPSTREHALKILLQSGKSASVMLARWSLETTLLTTAWHRNQF
jgi:hypothetical protein